jgi:hypothetical protein
VLLVKEKYRLNQLEISRGFQAYIHHGNKAEIVTLSDKYSCILSKTDHILIIVILIFLEKYLYFLQRLFSKHQPLLKNIFVKDSLNSNLQDFF